MVMTTGSWKVFAKVLKYVASMGAVKAVETDDGKGEKLVGQLVASMDA